MSLARAKCCSCLGTATNYWISNVIDHNKLVGTTKSLLFSLIMNVCSYTNPFQTLYAALLLSNIQQMYMHPSPYTAAGYAHVMLYCIAGNFCSD